MFNNKMHEEQSELLMDKKHSIIKIHYQLKLKDNKIIRMKEKIDELLEWTEKIGNSDQIVVVEGKEDKEALKRLGITNVAQLNKKPIYKIVEELVEEGKEVLILTDLDKKGKQLYGKINHDLQRFGVKVDNRFRNFLYKHTQLRQIEGLDTYINKLKKQTRAELL